MPAQLTNKVKFSELLLHKGTYKSRTGEVFAHSIEASVIHFSHLRHGADPRINPGPPKFSYPPLIVVYKVFSLGVTGLSRIYENRPYNIITDKWSGCCGALARVFQTSTPGCEPPRGRPNYNNTYSPTRKHDSRFRMSRVRETVAFRSYGARHRRLDSDFRINDYSGGV